MFARIKKEIKLEEASYVCKVSKKPFVLFFEKVTRLERKGGGGGHEIFFACK